MLLTIICLAVFDKAIVKILAKKKGTVIKTTDDPSILSYAQYVKVSENGRIKMQGSFEDVLVEYPEAQIPSKLIKEDKLVTKTAYQLWRLIKTVTKY